MVEAAEDRSADQIQLIRHHLRSARQHIAAKLAARGDAGDYAQTIQYIDSANWGLERILRSRPHAQEIVDFVKASNAPEVIALYATPARMAGRIEGRVAQQGLAFERIPPADPELQDRPLQTLVAQYKVVEKGSFDSGGRLTAFRTELVHRRLFPGVLTATASALPFIAGASESSFTFKYRNWVDEMGELSDAHGQPGAGYRFACDALAVCAASERHRVDVERVLDRLSNDDLGAIMLSAPAGVANDDERSLLFKLADERLFGRREAAVEAFIAAAGTAEKRLVYANARDASRLADGLIALAACKAALADWRLEDSPSCERLVAAQEQLHVKLRGLSAMAFARLEPENRKALAKACETLGFADIAALAS